MITISLNGKNITEYTDNLSISSNIESLGATVSFSVITEEDTEFNIEVKVGDKVEIKQDKNKVFNGIVVETNLNDNKTSCNALDMAFYLNSNKALQQFRNTSGTEGIKAICSKFGIPVEVSGIDIKINAIYKNKTLSEIIKDILKQEFERTGNKYYIYSLENKVKIEKLGSRTASLNYKINNLDNLSDIECIANETLTYSMGELRNAIKVVSNDNESNKVYGESEDGSSISKYGKLQDIVEIDAIQKDKAQDIAKTVLEKLNKIKETKNVNVITDSYILAGDKIKIKDKEYIANEVSLSVNNGVFNGTLLIEEVV